MGKPLAGTEVRIADDGEICVRGPHSLQGLLQGSRGDGRRSWWTAGCARGIWAPSTRKGYLTITGRKKEILITAGGKNVAPANIEAALKNHPLVEQAVLVGEARPYLVALIGLDPEATAGRDRAALRDEVARFVEAEVNPRFARVEQVKRFALLDRPLSIEDGDLTPTMKVKRKAVEAHFADVIEGLYADAS